MTQVLVTGGAGYIGSTLVPMLLSEGHSVHVIDNFMYRENSLGACFHDARLRVTVGDVRDKTTMKEALSTADVVIPLAAIVGAPACAKDPTAATSTNEAAVHLMLDLLSPDQLVIMPTTNSAYGKGEDDGYCDERSPLNPQSQYAREKVSVEKALMEHPRAISLRLATVFGMSPRMRLDLLVNDFVNRALRDRYIVLFEGGFRRNYIHVRDVAELFLFALSSEAKMVGEIYNAGLSSANLTKFQLCEEIKAQVPTLEIFEAPFAKDPDQRDYLVSNAKLEACGFVPRHTLQDGISELIRGIPTLRVSNFSNFG
jgi:nucleoside-diphosphate-sugar epimerase